MKPYRKFSEFRVSPEIFEQGYCGEFAFALYLAFAYPIIRIQDDYGGGLHVICAINRTTVVDWRGVMPLNQMWEYWRPSHIVIPDIDPEARFYDSNMLWQAQQRIADDPWKYIP